ncbi:MAG: type II secretion system F family protein [Zetaproteobacteria bacterium]|nr:MAG: type II secretion system F family protein [Zetaproteobacteria bacterium]
MAATGETAFVWEGKNAQGKKLRGEIEAKSEAIATAKLKKQGYTDLKVRKKAWYDLDLSPAKVEEKEITIFFRQLSTMMNAGLPVVQGFQLAEKGAENPAMLKLLVSVREMLEAGASLGEAFRKHPEEFDRLTCALIEAGEAGGILDKLLLRLCDYKEKAQALKAKIKSAMVYPISIIVIAFLVTAILMIFVVPVFGKMFSDMGGELPLPTRVVMEISHLFVQYWYLVFGAPVALVFAIKQIYATRKGRYEIDRLLLNLPVLGDVLRKAAVARFCRTFSTLTTAGVPILDCLDTTAEISGNLVLEEVIRGCKGSIEKGATLSEPLEKSGIFPIMVTQMIAIGEETGSMESMMAKIADFYEEEVDTAVEGMTSLMEPAIMAFLGIVIGGLVISMYLPIFKMASLVTG